MTTTLLMIEKSKSGKAVMDREVRLDYSLASVTNKMSDLIDKVSSEKG